MTPAGLAILASEISLDPLTRVYSGMTDAQIAVDINTEYRDAARDLGALIDYLVSTRAHTNIGQDTNLSNVTPSTILGRLIHVAELDVLEAALPVDPFGVGADAKRVDSTRELHSAKAFWGMIRAGHLSAALFTDTEQGDILNDLINCGIMNTANRDAIIALSQNQISRGVELGIGVVQEGDVTYAKTL